MPLMASSQVSGGAPSLGALLSSSPIGFNINIDSLIPIKLDESNYLMWRSLFETVLRGQKLLHHVDGSTDPPVATSAEFQHWHATDQVLLSWFNATLSLSALPYTIWAKTAKEAWDKLAQRYGRTTSTHVLALRRELHMIKKGARSMSDYLQEIKSIADQLATSNATVSNDDLQVIILDGLPIEYRRLASTIRARSRSLSGSLSMEELQGILIEKELWQIKNSSKMDRRLCDAAISKGVDDVCVIQQLYKEDPTLLRGTTAQGNTALHLAIRFGKHRFAAQIHELSPDLLAWVNVNGETPLHCVAACGWPRIWFWAMGVIDNLNVDNNIRVKFKRRNCHGETALHVALKNRNEIMAKSLLRADFGLSDCVNDMGESVFYLAAIFGYVDIVKMLLKSPSTASHKGLLGRSPLHGAIRAGNIEIVEAILGERPGEVKRMDEIGSTPLHYAVSSNQVRLVEILLSCDPSIAYDVNMDGNSPAHLATQMGFVQVLEKIIDYCPDCIDVVDARGRNVLHLAAHYGKPKVAKHILSRFRLGGVVNQQDVNGDTPLHIVSSKCEVHVLPKLIVDYTLNRRVENRKGHTAIESLPQEADNEVFVKLVEVGKVLDAVYSMNDDVTIERHRKKLSGITKTFSHYLFAHRMEKKSVVATLIATVTFTAAFTAPGGYFDGSDANPGHAILAREAAFKAFMVFDTLALILSLMAVTMATSSKESLDKYPTRALSLANELLPSSLLAMTLSFGTGIYAFVSRRSQPLANFVLVSCCLFILAYYLARVWLAFKLRYHVHAYRAQAHRAQAYRVEKTRRVINELKERMKRD